jgi:hypothetical protein
MKKRNEIEQKPIERQTSTTEEQLKAYRHALHLLRKAGLVSSERNIPGNTEKETTHPGKLQIGNYLTNQDPW